MISQCVPQECFRFFADLNAIPRGSGHEQKLGDYLMGFAAQRGLPAERDGAGNVLIRKSGTPGMESAPGIILQGHQDMVCVSENGLPFDFSTDPIRAVCTGDEITADGTTLGADDGAGLAMMLALLDSQELPHPPLEALATTGEEVSMTGAFAFDVSRLKGRYLLNLDSEEEGVFCVSCAGGRESRLTLPVETVPFKALPRYHDFSFFSVSVGGLLGGHSGIDIIRGRANAHVLLFRLLDALSHKFPLHIASLGGGAASNVIARESRALIAVAASQRTVEDELAMRQALFRREYEADGDGFVTLTAVPSHSGIRVYSSGSTLRAIRTGLLMPNGVLDLEPGMEARFARTSSNLAALNENGGSLEFLSLTRSSSPSRKEEVCSRIEALAALAGGKAVFSGDYPSWERDPHSRLEPLCSGLYEELFGRPAAVEAMHAGLECGVFADKFRKLGRKVDIISFGPSIRGAHTVEETLSRSSLERTWLFLRELVRRLGA